MKHTKGAAGVTTIAIVLVVLVLGGALYIALNPQVLQAPTSERTEEKANTPTDSKSSISWKFTDAGEVDTIPYTNVTVTISNVAYDMGKFQGSCSEIGATGGVDGKGLLAGELSGAQCWFAGGGDEIGVFAHEDGGFDIMVGALEEPIEGGAGFRGNFKIKHTIPL